MSTTRRTAARFAAAAALGATVSLGLATPAYAHPVITNMKCDPASNARFQCFVSYTGAHLPVTIRWYMDGRHYPPGDNKTNFIGLCALGPVTMRVVVTDVHGSDQLSDRFICGGLHD